jgi:hypothetical protein
MRFFRGMVRDKISINKKRMSDTTLLPGLRNFLHSCNILSTTGNTEFAVDYNLTATVC